MNARALVSRLVLALLAVGSAGGAARSDEQELRSLHETILRAHREQNPAAWLAIESDRYVVVNRGEISHPSKAERGKWIGLFLSSTRFREYEDVVTPIVKISKDGSVGWLIAQIHAAGVQTDASGKEKPLEFTSAWIELYEKRDGRWVSVGNVSNFAE
ncbi:MAG: nuclear transport factor 2 family protein [Thermoanaerobaculia bacterium]